MFSNVHLVLLQLLLEIEFKFQVTFDLVMDF